MNFKPLGATLGALLLATALAGCGGPGGNGGATTGGATGATSAGGSDTIATVGSGAVTRGQLSQTLEGIYGEQVLPQLIDTQLLDEALKAKNGSVSDAEVTTELARIEDQNPNVKTLVDGGGARVEVIKNQLRRNLVVQKLLTDGIAADPTKEKAFYTQFASYYNTPAQNKLGLLVASTKTRADQLARALAGKPDSFAALAAEQKGKSSTDPFAGQSTPDTGRFEAPEEFGTARGIPTQFVAPVVKALVTAKKGQILPVQALRPTGPFLIVKVVDRKEATKPDFAKNQPQVETDYKMGQAALAEIKKNPKNPGTLEQNVKQVVDYLSAPDPQTGQPRPKPSLRDALTFILRPASETLLEKLRTGGTVQIADATYKTVAKAYQPLPGAPSAVGGSPTGNAATGNSAAPASNSAATNSAAPAKP